MTFDEDSASPEELWQFYMGKYQNPNPIAQWLTHGFYRALGNIVSTLPEQARLLEVGCGPGESTRRLLPMLGDRTLEASEFEQRLVDFNLQHGFPVTLQQESVYALQRPDQAFDCVLLLEVLEHLEEPELALAEICRVTAGHIVVSVPREPLWCSLNFARGKYWSGWGNTPGHINHWSRRSFVDLIGQYGTVVSVESPIPWTIVHARVR